MGRLVRPVRPVDRYFTLHYGLNQATRKLPEKPTRNPGEDTCIARHRNGVCIVCLSPKHPIVQRKARIARVDYSTPLQTVTGKRKKNGLLADNDMKLCDVVCESGDVYGVNCSMHGIIAEYNAALAQKPILITTDPLWKGYLAVICPWSTRIQTAVDHLMGSEEYERIWPRGGVV